MTLLHNSKIALFPLDLVLFPGMMLPLHIFEPRYKAMIKECLGNGHPFGVVLVRKESDPSDIKAYKPPLSDMYTIGTTAHISAVEHLDDGRMNLITVGQDRFVIKNIQVSEDEFFVGEVDPFPMGDEDNLRLAPLVDKLRPMVQKYINHLAEASGEDLSQAILPTDPIALAYLAGTAMQGPLADKQKLLAATSLKSLIVNTMLVLNREDQILDYMLKAYEAHRQVERLPFVDYALN